MFDLVADVERYPEFVPFCDRLVVTARETHGEAEILTATMTIAYKAFRESFTTRVALRQAAREILVTYQNGPFSHLENRWTFFEVPGGTDVDFHISYDFRSRMLALLLGVAVGKAFSHFTNVFEDRARKIYGSKPVTA